jgi:hypothetical protein
VHTLELIPVGSLSPRDFLPSVGGLDSTQGDSTTPEGISSGVPGILYIILEPTRVTTDEAVLETVYQNESRSLTFILSRSPVIKARTEHHLKAMRAFVEAAQFHDVLILSATDAGVRGDESLRSCVTLSLASVPCWFVNSCYGNHDDIRETPLRQFILTPNTETKLMARLASTIPSYVPPSISPSTSLPLIPHGGNTRRLLESLSTPVPIENTGIAALLIYTAEGDNVDSAYFFAGTLIDVLEVECKRENGEVRAGRGEMSWREPTSWKTGLSGSSFNGIELFG